MASNDANIATQLLQSVWAPPVPEARWIAIVRTAQKVIEALTIPVLPRSNVGRSMLCFYGLSAPCFRMTIRSVNLAYQSMTGCRNVLGGCAIAFGLTAVAMLPLLGQPNVITTVAGNGQCQASGVCFSGDGGPATRAELNQPCGVAVDNAGNIYFADSINQRVRKVNTAGIISTVAGNGSGIFSGDGGPATDAGLAPQGVAVDSAGNIYIADQQNSRVRKVNTAGIISTIAGDGSGLFVVDGVPATGPDAGVIPWGLAVDSAGNLYIADLYNSRVRKVNTAGIISTVAGNGNQGFSGDGGPAIYSAVSPSGVAVDSAGNLYIADQGNHLIRKVNTAGIISTVAGNLSWDLNGSASNGDGGPATSAGMDAVSVAVDSAGNLYIADGDNRRIRKVNTAGIINTVAGDGTYGFSGDGGPATSSEMTNPSGVAVDSSGNIYIADTDNERIRKVTTFTTRTGTPVLSELGVVNNASFAVGSNPIAPGSIAAIFGTNLNDGYSVLFSNFGPDGKLVTTLGYAQVTINGEAAPLFYSTPSQLGVQIPTELTGTSATIEVTVAGTTSASMTISLDTFSPGIFTVNQSGQGQGAILISSSTLAAPSGSVLGRDARPAMPGESITIFCTGLGQVTPALPTGMPASSNMTVAEPTVTIGGIPATVQFSGMAYGFVGLNQVNVQVPTGTAFGNSIPVVLTIGGKRSNTVTMAVAAP